MSTQSKIEILILVIHLLPLLLRFHTPTSVDNSKKMKNVRQFSTLEKSISLLVEAEKAFIEQKQLRQEELQAMQLEETESC